MHVQVLGGLQGSNPAWYGQLTGHLTEVGVRSLSHVVFVLVFLFFLLDRCSRRLSVKLSLLPIRGIRFCCK